MNGKAEKTGMILAGIAIGDDEVEFSFMNFGTYATIPISVYRKIETDLKEKVWYIPTVSYTHLDVYKRQVFPLYRPSIGEIAVSKSSSIRVY